MKKKTLVLLTAGILGVSLAGGTFAAWAVTDNASPFKIYISPGDITTDDTNIVTLSWGSSQSMGNVSGLELNSYRKAGVLDLGADTSTGGSITATLSYTVADSFLAGLAEYINVDVYPGDLAEGAFNAPNYAPNKAYALNDFVVNSTKVYKCTTAYTAAAEEAFDSTKWAEYSIPSKVTFSTNAATITALDAPNHNLYTVLISLKSNLTSAVYSTLSNNEVSVEFDWGKTDEIVGAVFYTTGFGDAEHVYAYAWDSTDETKANAGWPGVEMQPALTDGYWQVAINTTKYDKVIFNDGTNQSGDLVINTFFGGSGSTYTNNCFYYDATAGEAKGTAGAHEDIQTLYYLVGEKLKIGSSSGVVAHWGLSDYGDNLDAALITLNNSGVGTITVYTTEANASLKVLSSTGDWYGVTHIADHADEANLVLPDGLSTYTITFSKEAATHLIAAKA